MKNFLRGLLLRLLFSPDEIALLREGLFEFSGACLAKAAMPPNRHLKQNLEAEGVAAAELRRGLFGEMY